MKCFECGQKCVTKYHFGAKDANGFEKVVAVNKICNSCGWESYKTILPEKIV
jgi:C4-type Zn-finger protein